MMDKKEDKRYKNGNLVQVKKPAKPMPKPKKKKKDPPMKIMPVYGSSY